MEETVMGSNRNIFILLILILLAILSSYSIASSDNIGDDKAIKSVFEGLSEAWEQADGDAWGSYFTDDADFTVWFGLHLDGRKKIAEGHQWVFDTVYPNTRYEFEVTDLKFLKSDIAVVHLNASIIEPGGELPAEPHTLPVAVLQNIDNIWKVVMFHNMKNRIKEIEEKREMGDMGIGDVRN